MTSSASQTNQNPATTTTAPAAVPSYASAAGANKKPTSNSPLIATGSHPPPVIASSAAAANGKPSTASPVNGRPNAAPPVALPVTTPAVVRGSAVVNGSGVDHSRKSSVTINAPNNIANGGGPMSGQIKFGFDSPAIAHSSPQVAGAVPIPIPGGNQRIQSPAQSPSPIPQQSGGQRAPSNAQVPLAFGSFPGEGDRHMKQHNLPVMGHNPHIRRDSQVSAHGDHGGPGHGRGFQGQGRGRGSFSYNNPNAGFPPSNRNFPGPGAGRGVPPYNNRGVPSYQGSPRQTAASPAGTPNMGHATPNIPHQQPGFYPPQQQAMYNHQVKSPLINNDSFSSSSSFKSSKNKKGARRDIEKGAHHHRGSNALQKQNGTELNQRPRRQSKLWDPTVEYHPQFNGGVMPHEYQDGPPSLYNYDPGRGVPMLGSPFMGNFDLSPESGTFEKLLTASKSQIHGSYMGPMDASFRPGGNYMPAYGMAPGMVAPVNYMQQAPYGAQPGYVPQAYPQTQPVAPAMSRNASQVSDRPASSTGPTPVPAIVQSTPQPRLTGAAPVVVSTPSFVRPPQKRSAAIVIKDAQGNPIDLNAMKAPASPAPSIQQSKTPPVVTSTPTPPPKPSTPSHSRNESTPGTKSSEQIRNEFMAQVANRVPAEGKPKTDEGAKEAADKAAAEAAAAEKAVAEKKEAEEKAAAEKKAAEEKAAAEKKAAEEKAAEEKAAAEKAAAEKAAAEKAAAEKAAEEKAAADKAAEEAKAKADAESKAKTEAKTEPAQDTTEEDEIERMIREMEEADRLREEEQAKITAKKEAEKAEAKKRADLEKLDTAANDRKLKEAEAEMERLEEEREKKRAAAAQGSAEPASTTSVITKKIEDLKISDSPAAAKPTSGDKPRGKPAALNLAPLKTTPVEAPQPSAALQSLRSARFLSGVEGDIYPEGIRSPNPSLNTAVHKKGKVFKYDAQFLLQFQQVFTEQPSMEFHQQVKNLIGDPDAPPRSAARTPGGASGRQNSRAGSSSAFPGGGPGVMGQFNAKPLPPGTTSEQRFAMAQAGMAGPRVGSMGGMGGFNRPGGFPSGNMSRHPSSGPGGLPSPRTGSRRGAGSKRGDNVGNAKAEAQAAKTMPLTAGMDLKPIVVSATGWKPTSIGNKAAQNPTAVVGQAGHLDPAMVQRKVKAALNKMTPENFEKISEQILTIAGQSKNEQDGRTLRQVIQLTFEKATDEAHWASMYAKFCKRMLETMSSDIRDENILDKAGNVVSGGPLFRKYLLNRCQTEFERGWKVDLPPAPEAKDDDKKTPGEVMLSEEYYIAAAAKRRGLGLVQFIGELYKLGMLTERIMHECVRKLLEYEDLPDEAEIESLSKLLRTIGGNLDSTERGHTMMDAYFQRILQMVDIPSLPSRLKFMLMDIVDLRKAGWHSKEANKGPKTLEEVRAEAEAAAAQKAAENARSNQRGAPGGRPMGRQDSRNFSYNNAPPNTVTSDDLRRLKSRGNSSQTMNSFGPTSMFSSRSNSGRRLGGPGGSFARAGEDSGASSRTGTPTPALVHANAFGLLADTGDHPGSPPPSHAALDDKKE
ncbi:hypothetical protein QBC35DRAFT_446304 [Podospora australis]|uniref:MIF4G domain-containing protein n=1 Tax=Podospora australis TaxID=1536484 RepID=A0AAN6X8D3_9PEZI|nr:hypothetical protein QBC35DRAFT_446304 [Podospora australis]